MGKKYLTPEEANRSYLRCDDKGNLYAEFDMNALYGRVLQCQSCGGFYKKNKRRCPVCGQMRCKDYFHYVDPVEFSSFYKEVEKEVSKLVAAEFPKGREYRLGDIHLKWGRFQQILLERYHIIWKTPGEMNPHICYD